MRSRYLVLLAFGVTLVAAAACSSVNPNPPVPHLIDGPLDRDVVDLMPDAGADDAADGEAGP